MSTPEEIAREAAETLRRYVCPNKDTVQQVILAAITRATASLTDKLAEAERERDEARKERDMWMEIAKKLYCRCDHDYGCDGGNNDWCACGFVRDINEYRDALLASTEHGKDKV